MSTIGVEAVVQQGLLARSTKDRTLRVDKGLDDIRKSAVSDIFIQESWSNGNWCCYVLREYQESNTGRRIVNCGSMKKLTYLLLIFIIGLSGCAITDEERHKGLSYMAEIKKDFLVFVSDCRVTDGYLYVPRRRVHNAPPTPWEMQDAVCYYDYTHAYSFDN